MESLLNTRPLTAVCRDIKDIQCPTASHFVTRVVTGAVAKMCFRNRKTSMRKLWTKVNATLEQFWAHLLKE